MTREQILIPVVLAIVVAGLGNGFYVLRNRVSDKLRLVFMLRSMSLTKSQVNSLERDVEADPTNFADIMELLYFYSSKGISSSLTSEELASRRKHILWTIANEPSSAFGSEPAMQFIRRAKTQMALRSLRAFGSGK